MQHGSVTPVVKKKTETIPVGFRVPREMVERLDLLAEQMSEAAHGAEISRTDAAIVALRVGLEALIEPAKKRRKGE